VRYPSGISFIGAGVILRDAKARTVEGLTTAATVWVTTAMPAASAAGTWSSSARPLRWRCWWQSR